MNRAQPVREISLRLADGPAPRVEVVLAASRTGRIEVAVHTPDQQLTHSLQSNIGELVGRLENRGYKTEAWFPSAASHLPAWPRSSHAGRGQDQPAHSGAWSSGQQQRGQRESGQRPAPQRVAELEETLSDEDAAKQSISRENL